MSLSLRKLSLLLTLVLFTTQFSIAETYTEGVLTYELDRSNSPYTATIVNVEQSVEAVTVPAFITASDYLDYEVVSISETAFEKCLALKTIVFGSYPECWSLDIPTNAFANCPLEKVTLYRGLRLADYNSSPFYFKTTINEIELGGVNTEISSRIFPGCYSVESIVLDNGVEIISSNAFKGFTSLTSLSLPSSLIEIGSNAFEKCSALTTLNIPAYVEKIDKNAFYDCTSLKDIFYLANDLINIDVSVFSKETYSNAVLHLSGNTYGKIPYPWNQFSNIKYEDGRTIVNHNNLTYNLDTTNNTAKLIGADAEITSVVIPATIVGPDGVSIYNVNTIEGNPFKNCAKLSEVIIADSEEDLHFKSSNFEKCPLNTIYIGRNIVFGGDTPFWLQKNISQLTLGGNITKISDKLFKSCDGFESIVIPSTVTYIGSYAFGGCSLLKTIELSEGIIQINDYAFNQCKSLENILLPNSLSIIGSYAFWHCVAMSEIALPQSVTSISNGTFFECTSLTTINLPGVSTIGQKAFAGCTSLTELTLPESLSSIRESAFEDCTGLKNIVLSNSLDSIGAFAFRNDSALASISIPSNVKTIGSSAFINCKSLTDLIIEDSENSLELNNKNTNGVGYLWDMFNYCPLNKIYIGRNLRYTDYNGKDIDVDYYISPFFYNREIVEATFGNKVTIIPDNIFWASESLKSVAIPTSVRYLGRNAFRQCFSLENIVIPNSVISLGCSVFNLCTALKEMNIPESIAEIGNSAFFGCKNLKAVSFVKTSSSSSPKLAPAIKSDDNSSSLLTTLNDSIFMNCQSLSYIELPATVQSIHDRAFIGCTSLDSIKLPDSVTAIGNEAFKGCTSLKKIELPNSIESIGQSCFYGCDELSSVRMPSNISSIGKESFGLCNKISKIIYPAKELLAATEDIFTSSTYLRSNLYLPASLISMAANVSPWNKFNNINSIPTESITIGNISSTLRRGETMQLSVTITPQDASQSVIWESSNPSVATVNESGLVTAVASGTTVISATAADDSAVSDQFELKVEKPIKGDANDNGIVTITDAVLTSNYIIGKPAINFCIEAADINGDGRISISDVTSIIQIILNQIDEDY